MTKTRRSLVAIYLAAFALLFLLPATVHAASPNLVISQVYGGGNNSGATLRNDYIEIFNRSASPVSLGGLSVQYASATGTGLLGSSGLITVLPSVMLGAGQYYLVQEAGGTTNGSPLPAPDAIGAINMSATGGKIALVNSTASLGCNGGSTPCSAAQLALIIDLIGYDGANFFEGTAAPGLSNTTAAIRVAAGCSDTDVNSVDFVAAAPNPHNTASPTTTCSGALPLSATASASNTSVAAGDPARFTVRVSPASGPVSTGITVTSNLSAIGGSSTQSFYDDGSNGDVTAGDNTFSFATTIGAGSPLGPVALPVSVKDAQFRTASTTINLTITLTGTPLAIHDIQGSGTTSPFTGVLVETTGIVTAIKSNGFFVQAPDSQADADPNTSEGVFVFTSSAAPVAAAVGNLVRVRGTVQEFSPPSDPFSPPSTEIITPVVIALSTGNPLPTPITLTAADATPGGGISQLEKFEGMRVHVDTLIATSPTGGSINESAATSTSNGIFFGVFPGTARPFREPGIATPEPLPPGTLACCVPSFDANPERIRVDSDGQLGATSVNVATGYMVTNLTGVLDYSTRAYTIIPDPGTPPSASGSIAAVPVPVPDAHEVTVAAFNMERFFDTANDPSTSDAVLTAAAFANRLNKGSLAIRNVLNTPDILGVEEMENLATLQALADKINGDAIAAGQPNPEYTAYLEEGNDIGGIDVGFLVKSTRIQVVDVTQYGLTTTYINPNNGQPELLNDRPPLVLHATVKTAGKELPLALTVIVNHLRSLSGLIDPVDGNRVRTKRAKQAEYLANLIQGFQLAGENVISVGDYNAYQFSDGYVDVVGTILGTPAPADQVVLPTDSGLVSPPLTDLVDTLDPSQRYSYVFDGNGQVLDHVLVNNTAYALLSRFAYARNDADFPEVFRNDANRPERLSDHDMPAAYFAVPLDTAPPVLTLPANITVAANSPAGTVVAYTATAHDAVDGDTAVTCNPPSGSTFHIGVTTVGCSSTDAHGNTATGTFTVSVHYLFSGFLPPLGGGGTHNAGSTIPVKWRLGFAGGGYVSSIAAVVGITVASNADCTGPAEGTPFPAASTGGTTLRFAGDGFIFNWKTEKSWTGCYNLLVTLDDGTTQSALVTMK